MIDWIFIVWSHCGTPGEIELEGFDDSYYRFLVCDWSVLGTGVLARPSGLVGEGAWWENLPVRDTGIMPVLVHEVSLAFDCHRCKRWASAALRHLNFNTHSPHRDMSALLSSPFSSSSFSSTSSSL